MSHALDTTIKAETLWMRLTGLRLPNTVVAATASARGAELPTHDSRLLRTPGLTASSPVLKEP